MSYQQALQKTLDAARAGSPGGLSTGEALMAALALNRPDWLAKMGYTIAEALDRIDTWAVYLVKVAREAAKVMEQEGLADRLAKDTVDFASLMRPIDQETQGVDLSAKLVTQGEAPGYRDTRLLFDLKPLSGKSTLRAWLHVNAADSANIAQHILGVHRFAWSTERGPLDRGVDEVRPRWLDRST